MTTYNLDKMVKVVCSDSIANPYREYRKALKIFGITIRPAGVYSTIFTHRFIASDSSTAMSWWLSGATINEYFNYTFKKTMFGWEKSKGIGL